MNRSFKSIQFHTATWIQHPLIDVLDVVRYDPQSGEYMILADFIDTSGFRNRNGGDCLLRDGMWIVKDESGPVMVFDERGYRRWRKSLKRD